jgi:hypothetical protein
MAAQTNASSDVAMAAPTNESFKCGNGLPAGFPERKEFPDTWPIQTRFRLPTSDSTLYHHMVRYLTGPSKMINDTQNFADYFGVTHSAIRHCLSKYRKARQASLQADPGDPSSLAHSLVVSILANQVRPRLVVMLPDVCRRRTTVRVIRPAHFSSPTILNPLVLVAGDGKGQGEKVAAQHHPLPTSLGQAAKMRQTM